MSLLPGTVGAATSNAIGFDTDTVVSLTDAQLFASQGYAFCVRYLSLGSEQAPGDLSAAEANDILQAGLALMSVQHVREPGWMPSQSLGQTDGSNSARHAQSIGFPRGVNVWCDLEGVASGASATQVIDYCTAWYTAVQAGGYQPGLYVGSDARLSSDQLYYDLPFQHYWQSCSDVPTVAVRGYQMVQTLVQAPVNGLGIDQDRTQTDNEGGQVIWLRVQPQARVNLDRRR